MHAYLLVGRESLNNQTSITKLASDLRAKIMEFPLVKIEDVRNLNNFIRLEFSEPTLIVCQDIQKLGDEASNAFLKNLEEPQDNIYFLLTTPSIRKVLPTIVSRCQIIKAANKHDLTTNGEEIATFLGITKGKKLSYIDKIKDRGEAIKFAENMVNFMHGSLHKNTLEYSTSGKNLELILKTLSRLNANGNVNLQLSNLVINLK